jgi:xanthine dehydrogenase accessory factor
VGGGLSEDRAMMERRQIVGLAKRMAQRPGWDGVLATLVRVEGSSYRRVGAQLLAAGTAHAGTLSGGCLEADVLRRAAFLVRDGAVVERYETSFDDTAEIPFGLGCGGVVDLLFEPTGTPEGGALLTAMEASLAGQEAKVVSFLPGGGRSLRRAIYASDGALIFASEALGEHKIACARGLAPGGELDGRFVEALEAPQRLFCLGAGDDAMPLVEMAARMGWSVTVADGRAQQATAARFPAAERVLVERGGEGLGIGRRDAVILMTHSYEQDRELLLGLLALPAEQMPRYLGLLGSRHRSSILLAETAAMLGRSVAECCERVYAPVGMDLGGDGPEAVALAIVAEVQTAVHGKLGAMGQRRLSAMEVARHIERGGASMYLQTQCGLAAGG